MTPRLRKPLALLTLALASFPALSTLVADPTTQPTLRDQYSRPPADWPAAAWDASIPAHDRRELGIAPAPAHPDDNPFSQPKSDLGWKLFFDPRLSGSGHVACASCHAPDRGWSDGRGASEGHLFQRTRRNAPGLTNVGLKPHFMWDGRATTLEDQALLPLENEREMHGGGLAQVAARLNAEPEYRAEFKAVFGSDEITVDHVAKALATFQRTIKSGRSDFDAFLRGKHDRLSDEALHGLHLFRTTAGCINCHGGPNLTDDKYHNLGLTYYKRKLQDLGRYTQTNDPADVGRFATPSLRNVTKTDPYMHNGLFDLAGVLNVYNAGGARPEPKTDADRADPLWPKTDPLLRELFLSKDELAALTAFLKALEEPRLRVRPPRIPGGQDPFSDPAENAGDDPP